MGPIAIFDTIHVFYYIISAIFYIYSTFNNKFSVLAK